MKTQFKKLCLCLSLCSILNLFILFIISEARGQGYPRSADQIFKAVSNLANPNNYSEQCSAITSTNLTHEGNKSIYLRIPKNPRPAPSSAVDGYPTALVVGGMHGNELAPPDALLHLAEIYLEALPDKSNGFTGKAILNGKDEILSGAEVSLIYERLDLIIFPLNNPDGRKKCMEDNNIKAGGTISSQTQISDPESGRKNSRDTVLWGSQNDGVDLNRNFDILWKHDSVYKDKGAFVDTSLDHGDKWFRGSTAFSEPESKNVRELLFSGGVTFFFDVHSWMGSDLGLSPFFDAGYIYYPWGLEDNGINTKWWFGNRQMDANRDGKNEPLYKEYMPVTSETAHKDIIAAMKQKVIAATGRKYKEYQANKEGIASGTATDWAFSLDRDRMRSFLIETKDLQVDNTKFNTYQKWEVAAAILGALLEISNNIVPDRDVRRIKPTIANGTQNVINVKIPAKSTPPAALVQSSLVEDCCANFNAPVAVDHAAVYPCLCI